MIALCGLGLGLGPHIYQSWLSRQATLLREEGNFEKRDALRSGDSNADLPLGITARLRCRRLNQELFILPETGQNLLLGPVWLKQTAELGGAGNAVLAAHRDSHFRFLKDVRLGDILNVQTSKGSYSYKIISMKVVYPGNRLLLRPQRESLLTLVTCYPFHFVGSAPQRFIVQAEKVKSVLYQIQH